LGFLLIVFHRENRKTITGLKDQVTVLNGDVASERRRRITVSTSHAPATQKGGPSSASLKTNLLTEVIKEEAENNFLMTEERKRAKSLAPWTGLDSPPSEVEQQSNLTKMTRLLGSGGGTSLKGLSSLKGGDSSATPQATRNEDANTLQSLQSVDAPGTAGSHTPSVQPKPQGLTRKIQAKLITPRKPPKIIERKAAAVSVMTFPRLPTMSDNSIYSQMRQDIRGMGFTQETLNDFIPSGRGEEGNMMLYDAMKNEVGGQKKVLPTRTMSLASLQPYDDRDGSKVLPVFPKLVAKQLKPKRVDKMKKISRQEYFEEKRSLGSYDKQALSSLLDPNFLHTEKAHFILLDKSNPNYRAISRPKGGYLEDRSASAPRGINFNFDAESYRLNDIGPIKTLQSNNSKTILPTNYISEMGAENSHDNSGGSIENTSQEKITVAKARTMNQLPQQSGRNSDRSLSPEAKMLEAIDFNHAQAVVEKADKNGPLSDQDIESLYNFLRSDVNNAGQKVSLLKRALGQSKDKDDFGDPVLQMEDQLRDILVLKNRAVFKSTINEWLSSHVACGKKCNHLRAFYRQSGFTKEFEQQHQSRQKGIEKKSIKPTTAQFSKMSNLI